MKKILAFLLLALAFTACQKKQYFSESPEIDLVKKGATAYTSGDWDGLRAIYADTVKVWVNTWDDKTAMNLDQFIEMEKTGAAGYSSYSIGDDAVYEMIITDKGQHWVHTWLNHTATLKNTGKTASNPVNISSLVANGKVVMQVFILDSLPGYLAAQDSTAAK